jgi:hypothetical protein
VDTNHLEVELANLRIEHEMLVKKFDELYAETEKLRSTYPIYDLVTAKEVEVERLEQSLEQFSLDHPDRRGAEELVRSHIIERDELRTILQRAEKRLKLQLEKIQNAAYSAGTAPSVSSDARNVRISEY